MDKTGKEDTQVFGLGGPECQYLYMDNPFSHGGCVKWKIPAQEKFGMTHTIVL
jgi:hypothetical protein